MRTFIALLVVTLLAIPVAYGEVYSNTVGLYKVDVVAGRNLVSMPFLPFSASLEDVIGSQLTGNPVSKFASDQIWAWDEASQDYMKAWYCTLPGNEGWKDWDTGGAPQFDFDPDNSYWIIINNVPKTLTFLGEVSEVDREIPLVGNRNLVSPSYPKEMSLDDSGLLDSGFTGNPVSKFASDQIWWWDTGTADYVKVWYSTLPGNEGWKDWSGSPIAKTILPGEGLWLLINNVTVPMWTWTAPKPY